jgi:hypothetical protein
VKRNCLQEKLCIFLSLCFGLSTSTCLYRTLYRSLCLSPPHNSYTHTTLFYLTLFFPYSHERYLWPFDNKMLQSCMTLNIFMENFPASYNPLSVLAIDMFTMTEEKLQDQLTKTMSVAFEGMVEMGGAALETRRLTYAWRLRHLLDYNAFRQKQFSDLLQSLCILFTALSTLAAVVYGYLLYISTSISLNVVLVHSTYSFSVRYIRRSYHVQQ